MQMVVNHTIWVKRIKPVSSGRVTSALNCEASSPSLPLQLFLPASDSIISSSPHSPIAYLLISIVQEGTEARQHCPLLFSPFIASHTFVLVGTLPPPLSLSPIHFLSFSYVSSSRFLFPFFLFPYSFLLLLYLPKPRGRPPFIVY